MAKIIILGAGVSGLTAALTLAPFHEVTVLEARNRVGGRIYTQIANDGTPIELGASFWEGKFDNPFYQQYFSQDNPHLPCTHTFDASQTVIFSRLHSDPQSIQQSYVTAQQFLHALTTKQQKSINAQQLIDTSEQDALVKLWLQMMQQHHSTPLSARYFPHLAPIDIWQHLEATSLDADLCFVANGYSKIPQLLFAQCQALGVQFYVNSEVLQMVNHQAGVTIHTAGETFVADIAICTLPLGVIKANPQLFLPPLVSAKQQALAAMGVHNATRVALTFAGFPFWKPTAPYILIDCPLVGVKAFRNNFPLHGKAILQTDNYADLAVKFYQQETNEMKVQEKLIAAVMADFRTVYPEAPDPIDSVIYSWSNDPFAKGAYPYWTQNATQHTQAALEAPHQHIYFAGADYSRVSCSVHNAYASGIRVAKEVGNLF